MTTKQQQLLLEYLGFSPGPIDGVPGARTSAALAAFSAAYGVGAEGLIDAVCGKIARKDFWAEIRYFKREEFRCPCGKCGGFPVEPTRAIALAVDQLRHNLGTPVNIVPLSGDPHAGGSGVRCPEYNATFPNSVSNSRHLEGKAVDFSAPLATAEQVEAQLNRMYYDKILRYWYRISARAWHMDVN